MVSLLSLSTKSSYRNINLFLVDWIKEMSFSKGFTKTYIYNFLLWNYLYLLYYMGFPGGTVVNNPPVMQETGVWSLGWEDPWRRKQQPTLVFLPGKSHRQEPGRLQSMGSQRVGHDLVTKHSNNYLFCSLPVAPTGIKFHEAKHFCRFY